MLHAPLRLDPLELPNRIVMAPMTRNRAGEGNVPTALMAEYYAQRASAGLIVTEATQVSPRGVGYPATPGIHTDAQEAGWRQVVDAVHAEGGRVFLQLWHVGRISHPSLQPDGALPVAPSAIRPDGEAMTYEGKQPFVEPRALDTDEIPEVVAEYARGAARARAAGFDGVEVHAANGYLIDQFLRDGANRREDGYGGSIPNRMRFLREVLEAVNGVWGAERVGVRLSPTSSFNDMSDSDPARLFEGVAKALAPLGLAYLHVIEPVDTPEDERIAPRIRAAFDGPLMLNEGYDARTGEEALAAGRAELISYGKPFLANPDLPRRFELGAPLNEPDPETFYGGDERGYTDYPVLSEAPAGDRPE